MQHKEYKENFDRFLRIENYTQKSSDFRFIPKELSKNKYILKDDVVVVRYGATAGYVGNGLEGVLANNLFKVEPKTDNLDKKYLFYFLRSDYSDSHFKKAMGGGAMPALSFRVVKDLKIPLPPLAIQKQLVLEAEKEEEIIKANKRLIEIMEKKIEKVIEEI